jgi:hypothetical protein
MTRRVLPAMAACTALRAAAMSTGPREVLSMVPPSWWIRSTNAGVRIPAPDRAQDQDLDNRLEIRALPLLRRYDGARKKAYGSHCSGPDISRCRSRCRRVCAHRLGTRSRASCSSGVWVSP